MYQEEPSDGADPMLMLVCLTRLAVGHYVGLEAELYTGSHAT